MVKHYELSGYDWGISPEAKQSRTYGTSAGKFVLPPTSSILMSRLSAGNRTITHSLVSKEKWKKIMHQAGFTRIYGPGYAILSNALDHGMRIIIKSLRDTRDEFPKKKTFGRDQKQLDFFLQRLKERGLAGAGGDFENFRKRFDELASHKNPRKSGVLHGTHHLVLLKAYHRLPSLAIVFTSFTKKLKKLYGDDSEIPIVRSRYAFGNDSLQMIRNDIESRTAQGYISYLSKQRVIKANLKSLFKAAIADQESEEEKGAVLRKLVYFIIITAPVIHEYLPSGQIPEGAAPFTVIQEGSSDLSPKTEFFIHPGIWVQMDPQDPRSVETMKNFWWIIEHPSLKSVRNDIYFYLLARNNGMEIPDYRLDMDKMAKEYIARGQTAKSKASRGTEISSAVDSFKGVLFRGSEAYDKLRSSPSTAPVAAAAKKEEAVDDDGDFHFEDDDEPEDLGFNQPGGDISDGEQDDWYDPLPNPPSPVQTTPRKSLKRGREFDSDRIIPVPEPRSKRTRTDKYDDYHQGVFGVPPPRRSERLEAQWLQRLQEVRDRMSPELRSLLPQNIIIPESESELENQLAWLERFRRVGEELSPEARSIASQMGGSTRTSREAEEKLTALLSQSPEELEKGALSKMKTTTKKKPSTSAVRSSSRKKIDKDTPVTPSARGKKVSFAGLAAARKKSTTAAAKAKRGDDPLTDVEMEDIFFGAVAPPPKKWVPMDKAEYTALAKRVRELKAQRHNRHSKWTNLPEAQKQQFFVEEAIYDREVRQRKAAADAAKLLKEVSAANKAKAAKLKTAAAKKKPAAVTGGGPQTRLKTAKATMAAKKKPTTTTVQGRRKSVVNKK